MCGWRRKYKSIQRARTPPRQNLIWDSNPDYRINPDPQSGCAGSLPKCIVFILMSAWLPHLTHGEYTVSSRSCVVHTCQMHWGERAGTLWWPKSHTHTSKLAQCMSDRGVTCLTSRFSFPTYSCKTELCQSDAGPPLCCHQRSQSCIPDKQMHRPLKHVHLTPGLLSEEEEGTCRMLVFD